MQLRTFSLTLALVLTGAGVTAGTIEPVADETSDAARIAAGAELYADYCARCHGVGMVDPGDGFFDLRTFPADQRSRFVEVVSNGKNSMPPWRAVLSPEEILSVFAYVVGDRVEE